MWHLNLRHVVAVSGYPHPLLPEAQRAAHPTELQLSSGPRLELDRVFPQTATTREGFRDIAVPLLQPVLEGVNTCLRLWQPGANKTSMIGPEGGRMAAGNRKKAFCRRSPRGSSGGSPRRRWTTRYCRVPSNPRIRCAANLWSTARACSTSREARIAPEAASRAADSDCGWMIIRYFFHTNNKTGYFVSIAMILIHLMSHK